MSRIRPPYFITVSTEKTAKRLKTLQRLGRHSTLCAGKACDKHTYWLVDIVVAPQSYKTVTGAARHSALTKNKPKNNNTVLVTFKASSELVDALDVLARKRRTTRSQLVRESITRYLYGWGDCRGGMGA